MVLDKRIKHPGGRRCQVLAPAHLNGYLHAIRERPRISLISVNPWCDKKGKPMTTASVGPTGPSPGAAGAPGKARTSGLAIASLVAGLLGLCTAGLGSLAGLILRDGGPEEDWPQRRGVARPRPRHRRPHRLRLHPPLWVLAAGIGGGVHSYYRSLESSEEEPAAPRVAGNRGARPVGPGPGRRRHDETRPHPPGQVHDGRRRKTGTRSPSPSRSTWASPK